MIQTAINRIVRTIRCFLPDRANQWMRGAVPTLCAVSLVACSYSHAQKLPTSNAKTLDGQPVTIPDVFLNRPAILVIGCSRKATTEFKVWSTQLFAAERKANANDVYDLVLLSDVPGFLRGIVTRAIRNDVSPNARSHFFALTEDGDAWKLLAQVSSPDETYLVILDGRGAVRWRDHGAFTEQRLKAATLALERIKGEDHSELAPLPVAGSVPTGSAREKVFGSR